MIKKFIIFFLFCLFTSFLVAQERYHKVPAKPGDGTYSLLRRYHLADYSCNISKFFELNKLTNQSGLNVGEYYYLPVLLYKYNGRTIRSTINRDNWDLAKRIEGYNEEMLKQDNRKTDFRVDKNLWVPYHEFHCSDKKEAEETTEVPEKEDEIDPLKKLVDVDLATATGSSRVFPIFGEKYAKTPLIDSKLRGQVYYIVSGHGGPDPGAIGIQKGHQLCEDEYAYDVALRLARHLTQHGATAYMIIRDPNDGIRDQKYIKGDYDELVWGGDKIYRGQKARLFQRSNIINSLYEKHKREGVTHQRTIMIHVDSGNKKQQTDLFFYHAIGSQESKDFADKIHQVMEQKYKKYRRTGEYHGTVTARDLHMLRETIPPAVYIELGNIRNSFDQKRVLIHTNREALAKWICEGIMKE